MTTHQEEVLKEEDGRKWLLQKEKENESNIKRKAQKHKMHDTFSHTYISIDTHTKSTNRDIRTNRALEANIIPPLLWLLSPPFSSTLVLLIV